MLFVYGCTGARAAVPAFQPGRFFRKLLLGCEALTYIAAILYFGLHWAIFGNPNSLGAVAGVALIPTLLWGYISAESNAQRWRLGSALMVAAVLVMSSFARAAIGAAALSLLLVCVALRQYRLLIKGAAVAAVIAVLVIMLVPRETDSPDLARSEPITSAFIYKGKQDQGVFGSRRGIWKQTWDAIQAHPWFGSGFGTSVTDEDLTRLDYATRHVDSWVVREHGNSYLAIVEWTGLLGVLPFFTLVALAVANVVKVLTWLRRTGDVFSPAVPAAAIVAAGLFHAMFEDWMFAVGYYLSVFFWAMTFILVDVMPRATIVQPEETVLPIPSRVLSAAGD
jgi:O-antigen ligase